MPAEIHEGDIGTIFRVTITDQAAAVVDLSGATTKEIIFKKSDGSFVTQVAAFFTDGTDGIIQYITIADDLDLVGGWCIQGHVVLPTGEWKTNIDTFIVNENLE